MSEHQFEYTHDWASLYFPLWDRLLPQNGISDVLEIGAFEGRSTVWFLQRWPDCHITAIDTFEGGHDHKQLGMDFSDVERRFRHNTATWQDRVTLHKGTSADWLRCMSTKMQFEVILVDGSHMAADVFTDIALAWPLLSAGGIMILDDMGWGQERPLPERPAPAIHAFLQCFAGQYDLLENGYQCIIRKL